MSIKPIIIAIATCLFVPAFASALEMPAVLTLPQNSLAAVTAQSYIVEEAATGNVLAKYNSDALRVPASLTKLVSTLVFFDTKPNLNKIVVMKQSDMDQGACTSGGACFSTKPGVAYKLGDLLRAALIASDNNAIAAVARSTGLSSSAFVSKMNAKVAALGMTSSHFVEPTGMDPANTTTAGDYAKIVREAFSNKAIRDSALMQSYSFSSTNNKRYVHTVKNTDKLLGDPDLTILGGKTGYLDESQYNFGSEIKDFLGNTIIVVVLGSRNYSSSFSDTKQLALQASVMLTFGGTGASVLGTSTMESTK